MKKLSVLFLGVLGSFGMQLIAGPSLTIVNKSRKPVIAIITHGNCRLQGNIESILLSQLGDFMENYFDKAINALAGDTSEQLTAEEAEKAAKKAAKERSKKRLEIQRDTLKGALGAYVGKGQPCAIRQIPANGGTVTVAPGGLAIFAGGFSIIVTDLDGNIVLGRDPQKKSVKLIDADPKKDKVKSIKANTTATIDEAGTLHYIAQGSTTESTVNH